MRILFALKNIKCKDNVKSRLCKKNCSEIKNKEMKTENVCFIINSPFSFPF